MSNAHDEIKRLLKVTRNALSKSTTIHENERIRKIYGVINEQNSYMTSGNVTDKINIAKSVEDTIEDDVDPEEDKKQAYRISGGILVLHGKDRSELELTTDEKVAFQETMDEFIEEVSNLVEFNRLNVYRNNVEWSGKIIDFDVDFFFSIGEENGLYINGEMARIDEQFLDLLNKLKAFYDKFKNKWGSILISRKKTSRGL